MTKETAANEYAERVCNGQFPITYTREEVVKHTANDFKAGADWHSHQTEAGASAVWVCDNDCQADKGDCCHPDNCKKKLVQSSPPAQEGKQGGLTAEEILYRNFGKGFFSEFEELCALGAMEEYKALPAAGKPSINLPSLESCMEKAKELFFSDYKTFEGVWKLSHEQLQSLISFCQTKK